MKLRKQHTKPAAILPKFGLWAQQNSKPARRYCLCSRPGLRRSAKIARRNFAINSIFSSQGVRPHFIGALQTNKAKYVVGKAELIQSVDRLALAEEINRLAQKAGLVQPVLIEINIGGEEQKSGILPGELPELLKLVSDMRNLSVKGLMCVPPAGNEDETRYFFAKMRELFLAAGEFSFPNFAAEQLSMGMSGDYKAAVAEGATMLRIGSAIFGARDYGRVRV